MTSAEMRRARAELRRYVDYVGGVAAAARRINCSASLLYKILDGRRSMTPAMAVNIERDAKRARLTPSLSPIVMVFGRSTPTT